MSAELRLAGVVAESIVDGPGIRATIFAQGCPHACPGCHNPQSHAFEGGKMVSVESLVRDISGNSLVRGVTFSGGEPFCQADAFASLAAVLREKGYEIACYTGYTFEHLLSNGTPAQLELLRLLDVLIDGRFVLAERSLSLRFRGSKNQRILDVPQSLAQGQAVWCSQARWIGE